MEKYLRFFNINKILLSVLFFCLGAFFALVVNGYLEYRFFSLPPAEIKPVKIQKEEKKDYSSIDFVFEDTLPSKPVIVEEKGKKEEKTVLSSGTSVGNITLIGTVMIEKGKYALLKINNNPQIVKEKDSIKGYKVEEIGKFYVVLSKGGNRYRLTVKVDTGATQRSSRVSSKPKPRQSKDTYVYKLDRRFVEEQTADIGKLLKDVFIVPVVRNGETIGFKLRYVKPGSLLYKYGLRSGDLILSVNGRPVRTVEEAFKIYNILRNENVVKIEIERRGNIKTIVYEIQ